MFSELSRPKLQAPKCDCRHPGSPDCADMNYKLRDDFRQLDIDDVTDSVMKVMLICGLKPMEVKLAARVIRRSFVYFEEVVQRIDRVPHKRFGKESFLHGLAYEAQMSRIDAQMAYAIVKRAFKAFYHGTGVEGRRFVYLQTKLVHDDECLWRHAARRTAEIHAVLAGMMHSEQRQFEERIECVYKSLVEVLKSRILFENDMVCVCGHQPTVLSQATQQGSRGPEPVSQADSLYSAEVEVLFNKKNLAASSAPSKTSTRSGTAQQSKNLSSASSRHNHGLRKGNQTPSNMQTPAAYPSGAIAFDGPTCNCPKLRCWQESGETLGSPEITAECSQGPYICRWLPYDGEEEQFPEHCVPYPPMEDVCPPCPTDDLPCDPECTCTCEVCTCRPAFADDDDVEEENLAERLSKSGIEDHDTDFCWLAPFRGSSRERMAKQRAKEELLRKQHQLAEEEEAEEEEEFQCRCTCDVKQRAFPHLFTYLTDFKDKQPEPVQEEPQPQSEPAVQETESEDLLSKPPPYGISLDTYRCWVKPESSESIDSEKQAKPSLVMVLGDSRNPDVQITIKKQHAEVKPAPAAAPLPKAPVLPNKPAPTPAPSKPPLAPQKPEEKEDKLTKEEILDIIGLRFKQKKSHRL